MKKCFKPGSLIALRRKSSVWLQGFNVELQLPDARGGVLFRYDAVGLILKSLWKERLYVILVNDDILVGSWKLFDIVKT